MNAPDQKEHFRDFLKDNIRLRIDFSETDQGRGLRAPPVEKPYDESAERISLVRPGKFENIRKVDLVSAIGGRASHRRYLNSPLSLEELSFLLWATQGVRGDRTGDSVCRTTPSAGCRHALETYLCLFNVERLKEGIYRYLPLEHQLLFEFKVENLAEKLAIASFGQSVTGKSAVTFIWTAIPYRMEWRYGLASYKTIALDIGHVGQNLYLACFAIQAGTCAIAAYNQDLIDDLLKVDGKEEFVIYLASVGKIE